MVALKLVTPANRTAAPASRASLLQAVLRAELAPGVTVFDAAYAGVMPAEERLLYGIDILRHNALLREAGLRYYSGSETTPGAVVLRDSRKFKARFPHLAAAVLALEACNGVRLNGQPFEARDVRPVEL